MTNPSLDIVMIAYRSEADLPSVLEGLKTMSFLPHELHLFDNIGNKKTLTMIWNELAFKGKGDYIVFLNTDIRLSPGWDLRLVDGMGRHADAGAILPKPIGHDWQNMIDPSKPIPKDSAIADPPTHEAMTKIGEMFKDRNGDYSFGGNCNAAFYAVMIRRVVFEALKGFDSRFRFYGQDHDFQRRLLSRFGKYSIVVDSAPVWHRCGGSVRKAAERGEVDFSGEMKHCGAMTDGLKAGTIVEWDLLSDEDRARVHADPKYNRMPVHH